MLSGVRLLADLAGPSSQGDHTVIGMGQHVVLDQKDQYQIGE
jgi:hypothetical protein